MILRNPGGGGEVGVAGGCCNGPVVLTCVVELGNSPEKGRNLPKEDQARARKQACIALPISSKTGIYHTG